MIFLQMQITAVILSVVVAVVICEGKDWHIGADRVNPSGTEVHGHANIPIHRGPDSRVDGNVHGSRVIGGPYNRQQTVGGGVQYEHRNGVRAGVDASHTRGHGNTVMGTVSVPF